LATNSGSCRPVACSSSTTPLPPNLIADLAEHAATTQSGLILLDTGDRPLPAAPSARLLALLQTELPWATALTAQTAETSTPPDLDPVLAQAGRLSQDQLTPEMREALQRRDRLRAANDTTYQHHLTASRMRQRSRNKGFEHGRESGIEI
jgi:alkylhydroperoxidase family enzyme